MHAVPNEATGLVDAWPGLALVAPEHEAAQRTLAGCRWGLAASTLSVEESE
jgi:hypothetical protein